MVQPTVAASQNTTPTGSAQDLSASGAAGGGTSRSDRLARKRSKSRSTQGDFRIQLTMEQKLDIIMSEHDLARNESTRREVANEKKLDQLKVCFTSIRVLLFFKSIFSLLQSDIEWMENEEMDFQIALEDFLKAKDSSIDKRTRKLVGEKLERYFNERLKARESLINKLRDRSSGLKRLITRLEGQLRQKEEMGETLHEVDFEQLKIENKQYLDKIDEKNIELIMLKRQVGKATQSLNRYKDELHRQTKDLVDIQQRIDKQKNLYTHAEQEMVDAGYEQSRAARVHHHLAEQTENYQVPEVLDYVKKKALLYNLERDCEVWERKVEIASVSHCGDLQGVKNLLLLLLFFQMALQQAKQQWQTLQRTAQYQNNPTNWTNELQA